MSQVEQSDQPVPTEKEAGQYRELRESLIKLGQIEPGLICETTKDGKPEVIVIPGRDFEVRHIETRETIGDRDTVVAISDGQIRILDIRAPYFGHNANVEFAVSGLFQKDKNGKVMTEEEIAKSLEHPGHGFMSIDPYKPTLDVKLKQLLKSLTNRNDQNAHYEEKEEEESYWREHHRLLKNRDPKKLARYEALKAAFDPETYTPEENLADRFNTLAQKLEPRQSQQPTVPHHAAMMFGSIKNSLK